MWLLFCGSNPCIEGDHKSSSDQSSIVKPQAKYFCTFPLFVPYDLDILPREQLWLLIYYNARQPVAELGQAQSWIFEIYLLLLLLLILLMTMLLFLLLFYPRNHPLKFGQNWVSNKWIVVVLIIVFVHVLVIIVVVDDENVVVFVVVLSQKPSIKVWSKSSQ